MNWRQWTGLCKSKGYKLEAMEEVLKDRPGYSRQTLSKLSKRRDPADPELIALAWSLDVRPGSEGDFEVWWRGLASLGVEVPASLLAQLGSAPSPGVEAKALAASLGLKLDAILGALTEKFDALRGKLDTVTAAVADVDAKSDVGEFQRAKDTRRILQAIWTSSGLVLVAIVVLLRCQPVSSSAPPGSVNVNIGIGAAEEFTRSQRRNWFRTIFGAETEMGKRKGWPMPRQPLPGQLTAPCPYPLTAFYGACWLETAYPTPCPDGLAEEGGKCWSPSFPPPPPPPKSEAPVPPNPEQR